MAGVEPAKGGRGKKGGIREAARRAGVPKSTAHDRKQETKLSENLYSRTVSPPAKRTVAEGLAFHKHSIHYRRAQTDWDALGLLASQS